MNRNVPDPRVKGEGKGKQTTERPEGKAKKLGARKAHSKQVLGRGGKKCAPPPGRNDVEPTQRRPPARGCVRPRSSDSAAHALSRGGLQARIGRYIQSRGPQTEGSVTYFPPMAVPSRAGEVQDRPVQPPGGRAEGGRG